ncbi:MAG: hypothetical protein Q9174_003236 [Haloplaca sp. 1 TL-2023]
MSQVATNVTRSVLSIKPYRHKDPVLRPREENPWDRKLTPSPAGKGTIQRQSREASPLSRPGLSSSSGKGHVDESNNGENELEEGEILDNTDQLRVAGPTRTAWRTSQADQRDQRMSRHEQRPASVLNPPSAAAVSRAASRGPYQRPPNYNRSLVQDPEQNYIHQRRLANRDVRLRKEEYKIGMIIRAPLHEQDSKGGQRRGGAGSSFATMASEATQAEKYITESRFGNIFTKVRKMIVVAMHQDNYVAVPLYTHNGRGLVNKAQPDEFVSVQDHRLRNEECKRLSRWDPLVTGHIKEGIDLFDPKSTAHMAHPVSRRYALPIILEGELKSTSIRLLLQLYGDYAGIEY